MRKSLLFFAAASLLLAGCAKEQLVEEKISNGVVTEVSATFENLVPDGATKASVAINGETGNFSWQNDDAAAFILDGGTSYGTGTYNSTTGMFTITGSAVQHKPAVFPENLVTSLTPTSDKVGSVKVPASREWKKDQTNVAMYGTYASDKYMFKHLGGLVKVTVVNVPTTAKTFVFKTADKKINGTFTVETDNESNEVIKTGTPATGEDTYTLNLPSTITANSTMDFYVPLPVGDGYKFAFYLKDDSSHDLVKIKGTTAQSVARKSILVMPTITLAAASIEDIYKSATIQEVPAGHFGDFLLAKSESVILKLMSSTDDKDITLKYNGVELPKNLKIVVEGDNFFDAKISGNLPKTHVDFTEGEIKEATFTTNNSTFSIVYPAKISGTLTVKGGNVFLKGATVNMIEVAEGAVADAQNNPVEINMVKYTPTATGSTEQTPKVTGSVVAKANVQVAPVEGETVTVVKVGDVNVEKTGGGTVVETGNEVPVSKFDAFKSAIDNVVAGQTIKVTANISNAKGITVPEGKQFTVDFGGKTYTCASDPAGSTGTKNQVFQLLKNSTITFKNGTIDLATTNQDEFRFLIQNYANLTLENIILDGTNLAITDRDRYTISNNCGTVEFKDNTTIKAAAQRGIAFDVCKNGSYTAPTVTWNSTGTVEGEIELTGGEFVVAKPLALTQPIRTKDAAAKLTVKADITPATGWTSANASDGLVIVKRKADLTIDGTAKISYNSNEQVYCAVKMTEKDDASDTENRAKLTVKGTVTLEGYNAGISGNGNTGRGNTDVTIEGGTIKGCKTNGDECCGIYQPQVGTLTIKGGTIEGLVGVYVKSGSVTTAVSGGTIKGTGAKGTYSPTGNGFINTGDAIVFDNCDYPGGAPNAEILGGTFTSAHGDAVASYAKSGNNPITGFIHGGTFSDESAIKYAAQNANINIALQANRNASGIFLGQNKNVKVTFDLGGKTLNFVAPAVGSKGTENQAFHIEQGNQLFTLKNGKVTIDKSAKTAFRFIIQNYNDLTVHNVELDGSNLGFADKTRYTVSNNQGTVNFTGSTSIKAASTNDIAFDVCKYASYDAPTVTWASTTGSVDGIIELTGGTLSLEEDLCINAPIFVKTNNQSTLELNGKKVYNISNIWETGPANKWFELIKVDGGKLTINDTSNGSVAARQEDCYAVNVINEGEIEINGGAFIGNVSAVQVDKGTATIKAGSFEQQQGTQYDKYLLNCVDENYKAKTATIIVKGGSFKRFNPADNAAEGANTNFVDSGYTSTETSTGVWTVSEQN